MPASIDHDSAIPVWRQFAQILRDRILTGDIPPGGRCPSETTCEQQYGISRGTVRKGIGLLRADGLVITVPGRGTYAATAADIDEYRART